MDGAESVESDLFPADSYDDVVVGAGLTGLVTAVLLAPGRRVVVLEARHVGAVTTGNTTGKLSLLQGTHLSSIRSAHSENVARAYVDGNRAGMEWILQYCDDHAVPYDRRDAWTYAGTPEGTRSVDQEFDAARRAGLPVLRHDATELPYPTHAAIRLPDQAQLYPQPCSPPWPATAPAGGVLVENCRVQARRRWSRRCHGGDHGSAPRRPQSCSPRASRSSIAGSTSPSSPRSAPTRRRLRVPGPLPAGMYLSADSPTRSLAPPGMATTSCWSSGATATTSAATVARPRNWSPT